MSAVNGSMDSMGTGYKHVKPDADSQAVTGRGWEITRALELATLFQTTLDLEQLINLFAAETQKQVPHDGLVYRNDELNVELTAGSRGRHSCTYRLSATEHSLGEVEFSRGRKFSDADTQQLEYMLSSVLNPLRNALLYTQAVTRALQDPLTGVNNRSSLERSLQREVSLAHRHGSSLALIVLDIDRFKSVNDRFGHLIGDCVLRDVASCAGSCIRSTDMLFRYGGEEFVILLSNTGRDGALLLAERIRATIQQLCCSYGDNTTLGITVSAGVACLRPEEDGAVMFERADQAMYRAKKAGRNRVVFAD